MSLPFSGNDLKNLDKFCKFVLHHPDRKKLLNEPQLSFFKEFLVDMGVPEANLNIAINLKLPQQQDVKKSANKKPLIQEITPEEEKVGNALDVDLEVEKQELGDSYLSIMGDTFHATKETRKTAVLIKRKAAESFKSGNYKRSALLLGQSIYLSGGKFAALFLKRAEALLELKKPMMARRDCNQALKLGNGSKLVALYLRAKANFVLDAHKAVIRDCKEAIPLIKTDVDKEKYEDGLLKMLQYSSKKEGISLNNEFKQKTGSKPNTNQNTMKVDLDLFTKDKGLMHRLRNDPNLGNILQDISENPHKMMDYVRKDPSILKLFQSFTNIMAQQNE